MVQIVASKTIVLQKNVTLFKNSIESNFAYCFAKKEVTVIPHTKAPTKNRFLERFTLSSCIFLYSYLVRKIFHSELRDLDGVQHNDVLFGEFLEHLIGWQPSAVNATTPNWFSLDEARGICFHTSCGKCLN